MTKLRDREQELTIHFVTPFSEFVDDITALKSHSLGRPELLIVMPNDTRFYTDLKLYKKTEKYIRVSRSSKQNDSILGILDSKGRQNDERFTIVQDRARELVGQARFFVAGEAMEIAGEDPKTRIVKGFNELVVRTYPNLVMLKNTKYDENEIRARSGYFEGFTH